MLPIVHHPAYVAPMPEGHRFPMGKFGKVLDLLKAQRLVDDANLHQPELASADLLQGAHDRAYVQAILNLTIEPAAAREIGLPITDRVATRSRAANGGTLLTARLALDHGLACNTAGGSHHAFAHKGSGFCVFNDVAVALNRLLAEGRIDRALVVDLDVHQGDGTALMMADEPRVFTFSMHCRTNFPARKQRSDLDIALEPLTEDALYLRTLQAHLPALLDTHRPDLVVYNAGVDPHLEDKLGRLALSEDGLLARERYVIESIVGRGIPLAGVLGGGYAPDLTSLARLHSILHRTAADIFRRRRL